MDEIREKVREFLAEFTSPDEKDIERFVGNIAAENPSLEIGLFRKNLIMLVKQAREIKVYEEELSFLEKDSPYYNELEIALKVAKEGKENLEDTSKELKTAERILKSVKAEGAEKLKTIEKIEESPRLEEPIEKEEEESSMKPTKDEKTAKLRGKRKEERIEKGELEGMEGLVQHLDADTTRELIKEGMTPEKHVRFEQLQEKLLSDVQTGMKTLKEAPPERHETLFEKVKTFFTKEAEEIEGYNQALHGPLVTFEGIAGYNEAERYWINEPYAFVVMLFNPEKNSYLYYVAEPKLSDFEDLFLKEIKDRLKDVLLFEDIKSDEDKEQILKSKVKRLVKDYAIDISPLTLEKILYYTRRDFIKFGKIDPLMHDNNIEDISSNGYDIPIYLYHKKYTNMPTNVYYTENELDSYVIRLAQRCGKHISIAEPMVDATMPDGSRIQMTLGTEVTTHGATFTIRKFSEVPITPVDLINWSTFSAEEMAYLWLCIENNKSLIFSGGTASGKTSSLNAVSLFIPWQAKIISLEDTRELKLPHPNWIPGITRDSFTADGRGTIDMYDLLRAALRQRPEYLLVGEVRGKEALTLFQAMSTGHTTFSTMHADSVSSAIHRLENPPISVPRSMIQALNIMSIQAQTYVNGKRARRNMKLVEITDIDPTTRNIRTNDIFVWDPLTDRFHRVGESKALNDILVRRGWNNSDLKKELSNRQKILEFMVNNKITDFNAIATIIHDYQVTPDRVLKNLNISG
jgi:flagellar protein FlaI